MVLGPVELNTTRDPRTSQTDEGGLDDVVVVYEMALLDLVIGHLHTTAQLGQNHHLEVLVLNIDGVVLLVDTLIADALDDGIRVYHTAAALIHAVLKEYGILLRRTHLVGGDGHLLSPCFYHCVLFFIGGYRKS